MVSSLLLVAALSIQGWTILSHSEPDALAVIAADGAASQGGSWRILRTSGIRTGRGVSDADRNENAA
jgi:hypothetical protein